MSRLVSVIIPCKNAAPWLGEAIESCLNQTWPNIEVIVVDNESSDESLVVAKSYEFGRVRVDRCKRKGASAARNLGLGLAQGDLVQFLDADDILDADKIRLQIERLTRAPEGTIASGAWAHFRQETADAVFLSEPVWKDFVPEEFLISSWLGGGIMPSFAWLAPRSAIQKAGPWDEQLSLNDDGEFFSRVLLASTGVAFCSSARGYYRSLPVPSLSKRKDEIALTSAFKATELSCQHLLDRCNSDAAKKACAYLFQIFIYNAYPHVSELTKAAERRVRELGGSALRAGGGPTFQTLSACFGWKFARRVQLYWQSIRSPECSMTNN